MQLVGMIAGRTPSCLDLQHVLADHQLWLSTNTCNMNRCISIFFFQKIMPCPFMSPKTFSTGPYTFVLYSKRIYILCQFQSFCARPKNDFHIVNSVLCQHNTFWRGTKTQFNFRSGPNYLDRNKTCWACT